jgi:molybdopterin synthase sulfur carrier subunit
MTVIVRFFARFRELLGTDLQVDERDTPDLYSLVKNVASQNREGFDLVFDEQERFREFVILVRNGKRIDTADAKNMQVNNGDEIAVFPPVSGG